jgi:hypothetical protein
MTNANTAGKQGGDNQKQPAHIIPDQQNLDQEADQQSAEEQEAQRKQANARTEAEAKSIDGKAGQSGKSSHDHMGHVKAGSHEGAGGGAKAKRDH